MFDRSDSFDIQMFQPTRILSSSTSGELLEEIRQSLEAGKTDILINLQNVMFMDSSGLATLVIAFKRVRAVAGRFALCSLNGQAKMLMEQSGMVKAFPIYESPEEFAGEFAEISDDRQLSRCNENRNFPI